MFLLVSSEYADDGPDDSNYDGGDDYDDDVGVDFDGDGMICENHCNKDTSEEWIENCIVQRNTCGEFVSCTTSCRYWCQSDTGPWSTKCHYEACGSSTECDDYNNYANDNEYRKQLESQQNSDKLIAILVIKSITYWR